MKKIFLAILVTLILPLVTYAQYKGTSIKEIIGDNPQMEKISLSSLKGKVVLVDFWASWCQPCRFENPALVKAYNQFHDKNFTNGNGFEIFSISIDSRKNDWLKAIEKDGLKWENHICDFKGWDSPLCDEFELNQIPTNYLIDKDGNIIARDLRGNDLEKKLQSLLVN